jgi:hypothetical protein
MLVPGIEEIFRFNRPQRDVSQERIGQIARTQPERLEVLALDYACCGYGGFH